MNKPLIFPFERLLNFEESNLIKRAIHKAIDVFESWGYNYLKLPAFEQYDAQKEALGSKVRESIALKDLSSEEVISLRADFTTQVVKSISFFKIWHFPLRVYYFGTLFSLSGSTYEKFQTGIELIGVREIEGDAEVIAAVHDYLKALGLKDLVVSIGHVGIVEKILSRVDEEKRDEIRQAFREKNVSLLRTTFSGDSISELPLIQGGFEVLSILDKLGLEKEKRELETIGRLLSEAEVNFIYDLSEV